MSPKVSASLAALAAGMLLGQAALAAPAEQRPLSAEDVDVVVQPSESYLISGSAERIEVAPSIDEKSLYGAYLAGRSALYAGDGREATERLAAAAEAMPEDGFLRERAFTAALFSGDVPTAARMAPPLNPDNPPLESLGRLAQAVEAFASDRPKEAIQRLGGRPIAFPHNVAADLLRPWAQAAAGDWDAALSDPPEPPGRIAELFGMLTRAQLAELNRKYDQADALYRRLVADEVASSLFRPMYGEFLERRGRRDEAIALYDAGLQASPGEVPLLAARERARRRARPPAPANFREGAAQSIGFAAAAMSAQRQSDLSLVYLRLALRIDPELHQGWVLVGDALEKGSDDEAAREAWGRVPADSIYYSEARTKILLSLQEAGEQETALAMAAELATSRPNDVRLNVTRAELLRANGRNEEALAVLDRVVASGRVGWRAHFLRAIALDSLDRWPEAEADLQKALEMAPDEPEILNYLGYAWIDRGDRVEQGMALVQKAVAARPQSGAMQDSLAWAHYRLGDYAKAVELLELAVGLSPADPEINDHLGDAYWRVGRRDEAGFQWNRVLSLDPDAEIKARVEQKLREGLPPAPSQTARTP